MTSEFSDGYEGVTHAGVLPVARDTGKIFLAQRAFDETDDEDVRETWEIVGGTLNEGEDPQTGAWREFHEEIGRPLGDLEVVHGWRTGDRDQYQGFVVLTPRETYIDPSEPDPTEVQAVGWFSLEEARGLNLRPEVASTDLEALVETALNTETGVDETEAEETGVEETGVSGNDEIEEPEFDVDDVDEGPLLVHGVLAPEGVESGDGREFAEYALTRRSPLRLPLSWQKVMRSGHDGSMVVGSIDRMMRDQDGLIHWEGELLASDEASEFMDLLVHFGKFGVSIDGDKASMNNDVRDKMMFDAARISGATACAIPAFQEAYISIGPHPDMPEDSSDDGSVLVAGARSNWHGPITADDAENMVFKRGKGWVTHPKRTRRIHRYWTEKGQPGYAKIRWGTNGDWTRCTILVGEKIAKNSPEKLRYIKRICAQWHNDALGYWPGEYDRPGNPKSATKASTATAQAPDGLEFDAEGQGWEVVLTSSAKVKSHPPLAYFHRHEDGGPLRIEEPDEFGIRRVYGYAAYWGVCHVGMDGVCVEPPRSYSDDYTDFHLGRTRTDEGFVPTGVLTYGVGHRDADQILAESPEQAFFDNTNNAWAAVRVGEDDTGIWFSGVVLPGIPEDHLTKIAASGQVSGEWLRGEMRACLTVNTSGFPIPQPSVTYDDEGNVMALAASAFGQAPDAPCGSEHAEPTPAERMQALRLVDAEVRFQKLREGWAG